MLVFDVSTIVNDVFPNVRCFIIISIVNTIFPIVITSHLSIIFSSLCVTTATLFDGISSHTSNVATIHPKLWSYAFYESAKKADYDMNRISVIWRVSTGVDVIGLMRHEPFRVKQDPDKRIIYNWQCTWEHGLQLGFCSHIFLRTLRRPRSDEEAIVGLCEKFKR